MRVAPVPVLSLLLLPFLAGCRDQLPTDARTPAPSALSAPNAPIEVPLSEDVHDLNPCTGQPILYSLRGTARIQSFGDHFTLVGWGTVTTSDGYQGYFNRTFVFQGDQVVQLRFHDTELDSGTGDRIMFALGLYHETDVNGQPVVAFEQYSGNRCVARGAS